MSDVESTPEVTPLGQSGGSGDESLCLELANTVDPRLGDHPRDKLVDYPDLVGWGRQRGILTPDREQALLDLARQHPGAAATTLGRAKELRETIYRVFSQTAEGKQPGEVDLAALRDAFADAMRHARIAERDARYAWDWTTAPNALERVLWPVAYSAVELLTSPGLPRVKECLGSGDCGWLFLDTSKNLSRRWCSMETCGSRVKMRRHYARKRAQRSEDPSHPRPLSPVARTERE